MPGASTLTAQVLVDGWPDDIIETDAWVEVTGLTSTEMMALKFLERKFPCDDRPDGEMYSCLHEKEWFIPAGTRHSDGSYSYEGAVYDPVEGPWLEVDGPGRRDVKQFWRIRVICPI